MGFIAKLCSRRRMNMKTIITLGLVLAAAAASSTAARAAGETCPKTINAGKTWTAGHSDTVGYFDWAWSAGVGAGVRLVGDCNAIGIEASAELRGHVFGSAVKPAEARLEAQTDKDDHQSLELKILALGMEIESYTIAESDQTLKATVLKSHVLPDELSGTLGPYELPIPGYDDPEFEMGYEVVGQYLAILSYDISPQKLDADLYVYVDAGASAYASGRVPMTWPLHDITIDGEAVFDLVRGYAEAEGSFTQTYKQPPVALAGSVIGQAQPSINNAWLVKGSTGYYIYEGLQGVLNAHIAIPAWPDQDVCLLQLDGLPEDFTYSNGWSYERVFYKPF
jgi:hypothetical protein